METGRHGRGSEPSAPASNTATQEGRHRPHVRAASCHVDFTTRADAAQIGADEAQIGPTRADSAPTCADSCRTGRIRADSDRIGRISVCFGRKKEISR